MATIAGAVCAAVLAVLGLGCLKAAHFLWKIQTYKKETKANNVEASAGFLALTTESSGTQENPSALCARSLTFFRINDEVMGGKSTSTLVIEDTSLVFAGKINTNGGGFASCRTLGDDQPLGLPAETSALLLDATGDGQRYKLVLHTADSWAMSVPSWSKDFVPGPRRTTHRLSLSGFVPSKQGRVQGLPPLDPATVTGFGFALSLYTADGQPNPDFGPGPFRLEVHSVHVEISS